jgi:hypothetical protein
MKKHDTWRIWYEQLDENGQPIGYGVYHKAYKLFGNACRVARDRYGDKTKYNYWIETRNPWTEYTCEVTCSICGAKYTVPESVYGSPLAGQRIHLAKWTPADNDRKGVYIVTRNVTIPHGDVCSVCFDEIMKTINSLKKEDDQL